MNRSMWFLTMAILAVLGRVMACAPRSVVQSSWELPGYVGGPFKELAVIGVMKSTEANRSFEAAMVERLEQAGVSAVPGFVILGNDQGKLTKEEMEKRVSASGADAVLISKLIAVDDTRTYVPPTTYTAPAGPYAGWWDDRYWGYYNPYPYDYWGYWWPAYQVVSSPGYWVTKSNYQVETTLYRVSDHRLIWMAMSDTIDPASELTIASSLSPVLIEKLKKSRLIA